MEYVVRRLDDGVYLDSNNALHQAGLHEARIFTGIGPAKNAIRNLARYGIVGVVYEIVPVVVTMEVVGEAVRVRVIDGEWEEIDGE